MSDGLAERPAAFLDRDGVINADHGFVHSHEAIVWMTGAADAIRWLNGRGYFVFVVTNQSGIARGYYDEQAVLGLHRWMAGELALLGARIDAFYYCPHHPDAVDRNLRQHCDCRKPKPGMLLRALAEWPVERSGSFLIGDRPTDIQAAEAAGLPGYLFDGGNLLTAVQQAAGSCQWHPSSSDPADMHAMPVEPDAPAAVLEHRRLR